MAEIVANAVEPDRALADHAFAHRLARRAGTMILVGPGPLVVAPDLSSGVPSDPATRAGRALALQLLGVTLARGDGLTPDQIIVSALPPWLTDEAAPGARAIAEVAVRRALFADHPLGFVEPPTGTDRSILWPYVQAAAAVHGGNIALVLRALDIAPDDPVAAARTARAASVVSVDVAGATVPGALTGIARDHAGGMVEAALATLDRLGDQGGGPSPATRRGRPAPRGRATPPPSAPRHSTRSHRCSARAADARRRPRRAAAAGSGPSRPATRMPRGARAFGSSASNSSASQVANARSTPSGSPTRRSRDGAMRSAGPGPNSRSIASGTEDRRRAQPSRDWKAIVG